MDSFGYGPPTDLTRASLYEYYFRCGALPVQPFSGGGGGCNGILDACVHDPIYRPGESQGLLLGRPDPATGVADLTWYVRPPSTDYNVYRGQGADLGGLACFQSDVTGTALTDDGAIAPSDLFVYLVTGFGCGGESTLGFDSDDLERINSAPCP